MKICMIGNSHLASLRLGWDKVQSELPNVELVFFAAPAAKMKGLRVKEGRLVAGNDFLSVQLAHISGGLMEIVPEDYDAFILYGLGCDVPRLPAGTSAALRRRAVEDYVSRKAIRITLRRLREVTDKIIWIGAAPLHGPEGMPGVQNFVAYSVLLESLQKALGDEKIAMLGQPTDTMTPDMTSLEKFVQGALFLPKPHKMGSESKLRSVEDRKHMNGEFGELWLRHNLPKVMTT